jgi:hypothetical protein
MNIALTIVVALLITLISYLAYPVKTKLFIAKLLALPIILEFKTKKLALLGISVYNERMRERGLITRHINTYYKMLGKCLDLNTVITDFIVSFIGEENMATKIQRKEDKIVYVPVSDRSSEAPMRFTMRSLSRREVADFKDGLIGISPQGRPNRVRSSTMKFEITLARLVGWSGVAYEDGTSLPFDPSKREQLYDLLPSQIQDELEAVFGDGGYNPDALSDAKALADEVNRDE